jgi:nitroimidazol reductase NimA-like FMN-containing flavoprotein (pyridoxamine 5'-phosphate oxidase superfamily)
MSAMRYEIPGWECRDLLAAEGVGRLCVSDGGYPLAFPVNYRVVRSDIAEQIVFRTSPSSALARCTGPASFELDDIDDDQRNAWSIIIRGELRRVVGEHELPDSHPLVAEGRYQWMVLEVRAMSGRRFKSAAPVDGFSVEWQSVG